MPAEEEEEVEVVPFMREVAPKIVEKGRPFVKSYRFTPDVHDGLDRLKEHLGAKSKNEALRIVFRKMGISVPQSLFREIGLNQKASEEDAE